MTLAIYCAGGLGKETLALVSLINRWDKIIFIDDIKDAHEYCGYPVYRFEETLLKPDEVEFIVASGEPLGRKKLFEKIKNSGYSLATLISPYASILPGTQIGEGCIIWDCGISADVSVGNNVLVNSHAMIGHDATIGMHSVISSYSFLGGCTLIGESVYMAPGAMAKDRIKIGDCAIVGMGAIVLRNVRSRAIMVGNPARRFGENESGRVFGMFDK